MNRADKTSYWFYDKEQDKVHFKELSTLSEFRNYLLFGTMNVSITEGSKKYSATYFKLL